MNVNLEPTQKSWEEFCKLRVYDKTVGFYGCVDRDGVWFDSSTSFEIAIHWCAYYAGEFDLKNELEWFSTEAIKQGLSIIHSDSLRKMYEAGILK